MFAYIVFIIVILFLKINTWHFCHFLFPFVHERWSILLAHLHVVVYIYSLGNHSCHNCKNHYCRHHNLFPFFLCEASMWGLLFYIILITISLFSGAKVMPFSWISVTKTWQNDEKGLFWYTSTKQQWRLDIRQAAMLSYWEMCHISYVSSDFWC